jgi:GntR family transcriptional regulator
MLLDIDHRSGVPIYRQVIDQIRRQIIAGQLPAGEQLISVRELAAQLNVNPMTVSKAYTLLETEGLVQRRRGVGLFVAEVQTDQKSRTKTNMLEQILAKAVTTAVQLDVPEHEVQQLTSSLFRKYGSNNGSQQDE